MVNLSLASPSCTYRAASWGGGGLLYQVLWIAHIQRHCRNLMPCSSEQDHQVCRHQKKNGGGGDIHLMLGSLPIIFVEERAISYACGMGIKQ